MAIVYKITNKINGKSYIGMTVRTIEERFRSHISATRQGSNFRFHSAIRKYGVDCWDLEILEENDDILFIRRREYELITEYKTIISTLGYNAKPGGCGGWIVPPEKYEGWKEKQKNNNKGSYNPRYCGLSNEELYEIVKKESLKLGKIPTHNYMIETFKGFPKSFTKFRFEGNYKNLAEKLKEKIGLEYNPYYRTEEHRKKLSKANLGKKITTENGKRIYVKN